MCMLSHRHLSFRSYAVGRGVGKAVVDAMPRFRTEERTANSATSLVNLIDPRAPNVPAWRALRM